MRDVQTFADEIFGFHAQQATEKALKAWLSWCGIAYPRIHDLEELLALLTQHDIAVPESFRGLCDLTDFAVQFRYETFEEEDEALDRPAMIHQVEAFVVYVEHLLTDPEGCSGL
jgi:HEPN domain-containing protein